MSKKNALKQLAEHKVEPNKQPIKHKASPDYLSEAFDEMYKKANKKKKIRKDRHGNSLEEIKRDKNNFISRISSSIKESKYIFRSLEPHFLIKPNGKERIICSPSLEDKIVQKSVLMLLHEKGYSFGNSINFGFVRDGGVEQSIRKAIEYRRVKHWAYKTDITSFFDKIDRNILKEKVKSKVRLKSLYDLIFQIIDCEIHCDSKFIKEKIRKAGIKSGLGLRQGMPISPYLSNLMLFEFDKKLESNKISAVRYADDLIIFANNHEECIKHHEMVKCELGKIGLSIPDPGDDSKTIIYSDVEIIDFLGIGIKLNNNEYYPIVTEKQMEKIKEKISNYQDINYCINNELTLSGLLNRLDRVINGYIQAYDICKNKENLKDRLRDLRKMVVVNIFKNHLSRDINLDKLTKNQKKFFEIDSA